MSLPEKPEGYDFREKRASKSDDAANWTAHDAIYSTAEQIKDKAVTQLVAYWWEKGPDGRETLKWTQATTSTAEHAYLLQCALAALIAPRG